MATVPDTEAWQRGPLPGFDPLLMPIVHTIVQVQEDIARLTRDVPAEHVWARPGGAASIGFHVRHAAGALDRLFTYARGEALTDEQRAFAKREGDAGEPPVSLPALAAESRLLLDRGLEQLRGTAPLSLLDARKVGRAGLPSTVIGLLFHAAEHATRHIGQAITTARVLKGS